MDVAVTVTLVVHFGGQSYNHTHSILCRAELQSHSKSTVEGKLQSQLLLSVDSASGFQGFHGQFFVQV